MLTSFDKAIASIVVPLLVAGLAHFGFAASDEFTAALALVVSGLAVYLVPNKQA